MAPKRLSPLDEPPAASSTEEEVSSSEGEGEEEEGEEAGSGSGSGSEEEEDDEAEAEEPKTSSLASNHAADKKPQPLSKKDNPAAANSKPDSSSTESESESGSDSETEPDNTRRSAGAADPNVKPIASKPMEDATAAKKATSKSIVTPAAASSRKRSTASGKSEAKDSKRPKKNDPEPDDDEERSVADEEHKKSGDEKKLFQRLWSEDDEIVILKGMIDYTSKKGADPSADMNAFHDFIKKSLEINFTKAQLADKVRRLKKKYENNAKKGNKYNPTKPHEVKAFELSKKIWVGGGSSGGGGEESKPNGKVKNNPKSNRSLASLKAELLSTPEHPKEAEKMEVDGNAGVSNTLREVVEFSKCWGAVGLPEQVVKKGLDLLSRSKKAEMEERWNKLHLAELELYAKRTELISVQAKLIWDAYNKSSNH